MKQSVPMADSGNYWTAAYAKPPLDRLERLDGDSVSDWLNRTMPFVGSKIDWPRVTGSHQHWSKAPANADVGSVLLEKVLAALPALCRVDHVGDSLSPFEVRIEGRQMIDAIRTLISIPEHHYFVATDRSWVAVVALEGDIDLVIL